METTPESLLQHLDFVRALARGLLFDENRADDVVQQAWLAANRAAPEDKGAIRAWFARVTRNAVKNEQRGGERRRRRERGAARPEAIPSTSQVVEREELRSRVVQAVLALDEPYRSTVLLRYFEDLAPADIGRRLGVPAATVRTRLKRGLERVRDQLDRDFGGDRRAWTLALVPLARGPVTTAAGTNVIWWKTAGFAAAVLLGTLLVMRVIDPDRSPPVSDSDTDPLAASDVGESAPTKIEGTAQRTAAGSDAKPTESDGRTPGFVGFRGRLILPDGNPVAGAPIEIHAVNAPDLFFVGADPMAHASRPIPLARATSQTDTKGQFEVAGLPPQAAYVLHAARDTRHATFRFVERTPAPDDVCDLGDIRANVGASVSGRVVSRSGEPVSGAEVIGMDLPGTLIAAAVPPSLDAKTGLAILRDGPKVFEYATKLRSLVDLLPVARTKTAADGTFALNGLAPGTNTVVVRASGFSPMVRGALRIAAGADKNIGNVRLRPGRRVHGRILDSDKTRVSGAEVWVAPVGLVATVGFATHSTKTDSQGAFAIEGLPRGRGLVAVRRKKGDAWHVVGPVPLGRSIDVRLAKREDLQIALRSKRGADIETPRLKVVPGRVSGELLLSGHIDGVELAGRVTELRDGALTVRGLDAGIVTVLVSAPGHAAACATIDLAKSQRLAIDLEPASSIEVLVRGPDGKPLPGSTISVRQLGARDWERSLIPSWSIFPHWPTVPRFGGKTDAHGVVRVDGCRAGPLALVARHARYGFASLKLEKPSQRAEIRLQALGSIAGRLTDGGNAPPHGKWVLLVQPSKKQSIDAPRTASVDEDGSFLVEGLPPGKYTVRALSGLRGVRSLGTAYSYLTRSMFELDGNTTSVEVVAGRRANVTFDASPGHAAPGEEHIEITGRVRIDGVPAAGLRVKFGAFFSSLGKTKTDVAGRFSLGRLRPGFLVIDIENDTGVLWHVGDSFSPGASKHFEIDLRLAAIAGTIVDARGPVATKVTLDGSDSARGASFVASSGPNGTFRIDGVPAGSYIAKIDDRTAGFAQQRFRVDAGQLVPDLVLRLRPMFAVSVTLADGPWRGHEGFLALRGQGDEPHRQVSITKQGTARFANLPAGTYTARLTWLEKKGQSMRSNRRRLKDVTVGDSDLSVKLEPHPQK